MKASRLARQLYVISSTESLSDPADRVTAEASKSIIQLEGLRRDFHVGDEVVHALNGIDLQIDAGAYLSIMGPSGSGKSTLLYILGLLDVPTAGEYRLAGINTAQMNDNERANARQRDIGFIFQSFHLVPRMNAAENVELPLTLAGMAPAERRKLVDRALDDVALGDRAGHRPDQLSGGQRQRVAIARAIVMQPKVLLADEPTGNLDSKTAEEIIGLLAALNSERGLTVMMVSHDEAAAREVSHRVLRLLDGRVIDELSGRAGG